MHRLKRRISNSLRCHDIIPFDDAIKEKSQNIFEDYDLYNNFSRAFQGFFGIAWDSNNNNIYTYHYFVVEFFQLMNKKDTKTAIVAAEIDKNSNLIRQIECVDIKDGNARTISLYKYSKKWL